MNAASNQSWHDANQAHLSREIAALRLTLQRRSGALPAAGDADSPEPETAAQASEAIHPAPALEQLCGAFGLSGFERATLLLCDRGATAATGRATCRWRPPPLRPVFCTGNPLTPTRSSRTSPLPARVRGRYPRV